ncbi:MAG: hypothetical protein ACRC7O_19195 [Fimbriiglobus sp.]
MTADPAGRGGGDSPTAMLTSDDYRLITAAVDGVLTPTQEPALRGLLAASEEAAAVYRQLRTDSARLARLRKVSAPPELHAAVMARVRPVTVPTPARRVRVPAWASYAVSAAVLVAVGVGLLVTAATRPVQESPSVAVARAHSLPQPTRGPDGRDVPTVVARAADRTVTEVEAPKRPNPAAVASNTPKPTDALPAPRPNVPDILGSAVPPDLKPFESVEVRLPLLLTVAELDGPDAQARFAAELAREPAFRLDLFARDTIRAADVFQAAAKSVGLTVMVEATAQERLKRKLPTAWAVYTEALTADDVAKLASALAVHDRAADAGVFGTAHLIPARTAEQRDVKDLFGVDLGLGKRPTPGPVVGKPLSAGTVEQVTAMLKGKAPDKPALLLVHLPTASRAAPGASKEVREFLARREGRKPNAVPLLVVIRPAGN